MRAPLRLITTVVSLALLVSGCAPLGNRGNQNAALIRIIHEQLGETERKSLSLKTSGAIQHGNIDADVPDFWGIYRIGADLAREAIEQEGSAMRPLVGIADLEFDVTNPLLKPQIRRHNVTGPRQQATHGTHIAGTVAVDAPFSVAGRNAELSLAVVGEEYLPELGKKRRILSHRRFRKKLPEIFPRALKFLSIDKPDILSSSVEFQLNFLPTFSAAPIIDQSDVLFVLAAGNAASELALGGNEAPDERDNLLWISALDISGVLGTVSNFGDAIFLTAPGIEIYSLAGSIVRRQQEETRIPHGIEKDTVSLVQQNGTSMAAPHVTGVIALVLASNPLLDRSELKRVLQETAIDLGPPGRDIFYGYGMVNAYGAVRLAQLLARGKSFEEATRELRSESESWAKRGGDSLRALAEDNRTETLLDAFHALRRAHFSDPSNLSHREALLYFHQNFGFSAEARAYALDLFYNTGDETYGEIASDNGKITQWLERSKTLTKELEWHDAIDVENVVALLDGLSNDERQQLSLRKHVQHGALPLDTPDFWGNYRTGADLANEEFAATEETKSLTIGVIDEGFSFEEGSLGSNQLDRALPTTFGQFPMHGTHVVGTIAGNGAYAVCQNCGITLALRDATDRNVDPDSYKARLKTQFDSLLGLENLRVVQSSLGFGSGEEIREHIARTLEGKNTLYVFAAGNDADRMDGRNHDYPGGEDLVLPIGALAPIGTLSSKSNYGKTLFLVAPGEHIFSLLAAGEEPEKDAITIFDETSKVELATMHGTSMAAPFVSGTMARMLRENPDLSAKSLQSILRDTAIDLGLPGRDPIYGHGLVNTYAATLWAKLSRRKSPAEIRMQLKTQAKALAIEATQTLEQALLELSSDPLLQGITLMRKAYFLDPNNTTVVRALFHLHRVLGFRTESFARALEYWQKTRDEKLLAKLDLSHAELQARKDYKRLALEARFERTLPLLTRFQSFNKRLEAGLTLMTAFEKEVSNPLEVAIYKDGVLDKVTAGIATQADLVHLVATLASTPTNSTHSALLRIVTTLYPAKTNPRDWKAWQRREYGDIAKMLLERAEPTLEHALALEQLEKFCLPIIFDEASLARYLEQDAPFVRETAERLLKTKKGEGSCTSLLP